MPRNFANMRVMVCTFILGAAKVDLVDEKSPIHNFSQYIQTAKHPTLKSIFRDYKSPYHLPTQLYYHTYKYGFLIGFPLFSAKLLIWFIRFYV
jgi:hypothetical protein